MLTSNEYPATWIEYPEDDGSHASDPDYAAAKKAVIEEFGEQALRESWLQVCKDLESVTKDIAARKSDAVPIFDGAGILSDGFSQDQQDAVKQRGCFIVRNVIPKEEIRDLYRGLRQYVGDNRSQIRTWPEGHPVMFVIYDSPTQIALRTHPNQLKLQEKINGLWHDDTGATSMSPLAYSDGVRDRAAGAPFPSFGPHTDAGSLCRWADPGYRKAYAKVFGGRSREYDAFDLTTRKDANQNLFVGPAHSTVFRAFQGWTAMTTAGPHEGSIMLYPDVKTASAYMLLRPFFKPPPDENDIMDATKWTFDSESAWFPATPKPHSQQYSRASHPHMRLEDCVVHVPQIQAGDTVWWHSDMCHAVDPEHKGSENAAVAYIAAVPSTEQNKRYIAEQLKCTLEGRVPPDFSVGGRGTNMDERKFVGYKGHVGLSEAARRALGYGTSIS